MSHYQWKADIFKSDMKYDSLEHLERTIKEAREAYENGTWTGFQLDAEYEDGSIEVFLRGERKETYNEYTERMNYEQAVLDHQKRIRRETYEKLKKEFEGQ